MATITIPSLMVRIMCNHIILKEEEKCKEAWREGIQKTIEHHANRRFFKKNLTREQAREIFKREARATWLEDPDTIFERECARANLLFEMARNATEVTVNDREFEYLHKYAPKQNCNFVESNSTEVKI